MSAFWALPKGVGFESQHEKEQILMVLRQHPVVNLKWMATVVALLLGPVLVSPLFPFFSFLPERFFLLPQPGLADVNFGLCDRKYLELVLQSLYHY